MNIPVTNITENADFNQRVHRDLNNPQFAPEFPWSHGFPYGEAQGPVP